MNPRGILLIIFGAFAVVIVLGIRDETQGTAKMLLYAMALVIPSICGMAARRLKEKKDRSWRRTKKGNDLEEKE